MWNSVGNYVTDLIFKMEQLDEDFVGSTWVEAAAIHEEAPPPPAGMSEQQQAAIDGTQADQKLEPIRNRERKVGRNDPCPCGSGKKYKNCCMRQARNVSRSVSSRASRSNGDANRHTTRERNPAWLDLLHGR